MRPKQKVFYDFEFVEQGPDHPIRPLSLGVVATDENLENAREFYVQMYDNLYYGIRHDWVRENVLPLFEHLQMQQMDAGKWLDLSLCPGKACSGIHQEPTLAQLETCPWVTSKQTGQLLLEFLDIPRYGDIELWGYYADYDHVALSQLYGKMIDLPKGFPMYTLDLKQLAVAKGNPKLPSLVGAREHHALDDAREMALRYMYLQLGQGA